MRCCGASGRSPTSTASGVFSQSPNGVRTLVLGVRPTIDTVFDERARIAAAGGEVPRMRWWNAARAGRRVEERWRRVAGIALAALVGLALSGAGSATPGGVSGGKATAFTGYAFDACNAPKPESLAAWLASPYRALGIYIGGANRACANTQLSPDWTASAVATGWSLIPLYVGLQAPCVGGKGLAKISPALASSQGTAAADDAAVDAAAVGLAAGSPIYFDMEAYALSNPACTAAVQAFVTAWVNELHALGYLAGVYGSAASTIRDLQALATTASAPDEVWIADWNGNESVFGNPYVSDALWTNHQRIHQYRGAHHETWGGVTIDIDSNYVDAAVVGAGGTLPVPPPPLPTPAPGESAAGSVTSIDGGATVSWPAGAFQQSVVVSLTPALPAEPVAGFGGGGYGVQLQVQQTATALLRKGFSAPLTIHLTRRPDGLAPMSSSDGVGWQPLPPLYSGALPTGARAGYTRNADGSVDIADDRRRLLRAPPREDTATRPDGPGRPLLARPARPQLAEVGRRGWSSRLLPGHTRREAAPLDPRPDHGRSLRGSTTPRRASTA